jgi:hypothetical protein
MTALSFVLLSKELVVFVTQLMHIEALALCCPVPAHTGWGSVFPPALSLLGRMKERTLRARAA